MCEAYNAAHNLQMLPKAGSMLGFALRRFTSHIQLEVMIRWTPRSHQHNQRRQLSL